MLLIRPSIYYIKGNYTMYALICSGGRQYRVETGKQLRVHLLKEEVNSTLEIKEVLFMRDEKDFFLGQPFVEGGKVEVLIRGHGRGKKILVFKKRRRKGYRRHQGHRQSYTEILITALHSPKGKVDRLPKDFRLDKEKKVTSDSVPTSQDASKGTTQNTTATATAKGKSKKKVKASPPKRGVLAAPVSKKKKQQKKKTRKKTVARKTAKVSKESTRRSKKKTTKQK